MFEEVSKGVQRDENRIGFVFVDVVDGGKPDPVLAIAFRVKTRF